MFQAIEPNAAFPANFDIHPSSSAMFKQLLKLLVFIALPILFLLMSDWFNPLKIVVGWFNERSVTLVYESTLSSISDKVDAAPSAEKHAVFDKVTLHFINEIRLVNIEDSTSNDKNRERLRAGELVYLDAADDIYGYKLKQSDHVILFTDEPSEGYPNYLLARGPMLHARDLFLASKTNDVDQALKDVEDFLGFDAKAMTESQVAEMTAGMSQYLFDDVGVYEDDDYAEYYVTSLEGGTNLVVGPVRFSPIKVSVYFFLVLLAVIPLTLVSASILLWLWPLWRDHKVLKKEVQKFGQGHLSSRVDIPKGSMAAELSDTFNSMADKIQALIQTNKDLTNAVAHDLRTPLARLRFAVEMQDAEGNTDEIRAKYRNSIDRNIAALDQLINTVLVHSRYNRVAEIKHFKLTPLASLIEEELDHFIPEYPHLEVTFECDPSLKASNQKVDGQAILRALDNLLGNAARFAKSKIEIRYYQKGDSLCLEVNDDGPGIAEADAERLLLPFTQAENSERANAKGHGLGLAIVNQIAKWHQGTVAIKKSPLGGASITLSWPNER